jgi:hypothetical protein
VHRTACVPRPISFDRAGVVRLWLACAGLAYPQIWVKISEHLVQHMQSFVPHEALNLGQIVGVEQGVESQLASRTEERSPPLLLQVTNPIQQRRSPIWLLSFCLLACRV